MMPLLFSSGIIFFFVTASVEYSDALYFYPDWEEKALLLAYIPFAGTNK